MSGPSNGRAPGPDFRAIPGQLRQWHILSLRALDARLRQAWEVGPGGQPIAVPTPADVSDFSLSNLGFQVRYRYELAPLSDLYVVYSRGGLDEENQSRSLADLLGDATSLRDAEQILVKLSYRFSN